MYLGVIILIYIICNCHPLFKATTVTSTTAASAVPSVAHAETEWGGFNDEDYGGFADGNDEVGDGGLNTKAHRITLHCKS